MCARKTQHFEMPAASTGTFRKLKTIRYGDPESRPKAYLQAALHADEVPGMLVIRYLDELLSEADKRREIRGEIVLVPVANPIGLSQFVHGTLSGRFQLRNGLNFNRNFLDLTNPVAARVEHDLSSSPAQNVALIRATMLDELAAMSAQDELTELRRTLMLLAADADICLDLHCDQDAILHLYLGTPLWPHASDLAAQLGSRATLLSDRSDGNPFDETIGGIWWSLAGRFSSYPIPPACLSATVELRGQIDIDHSVARQDAANLFSFLMRRGLVDGDAGPLPELTVAAAPLDGVEHIEAPHAGVVIYTKRPGDEIQAGEIVAEVVDPWAECFSESTKLISSIDGKMYARRHDRYAHAGQTLCRISGSESLPVPLGRSLLSD